MTLTPSLLLQNWDSDLVHIREKQSVMSVQTTQEKVRNVKKKTQILCQNTYQRENHFDLSCINTFSLLDFWNIV